MAGLLQDVVSLSPMMLHLFVRVSCKNLVRPVIVIVRLKIPLLLREYKVCCCRQEFPFPSIYLVLLSLLANQSEAETHFISGIIKICDGDVWSRAQRVSLTVERPDGPTWAQC